MSNDQERNDYFHLGIRRRVFCLGCGKRHEEDCGCPAGTSERLVNTRAERAEARTRELEEVLGILRAEYGNATDLHIAMSGVLDRVDNALTNGEKEQEDE